MDPRICILSYSITHFSFNSRSPHFSSSATEQLWSDIFITIWSDILLLSTESSVKQEGEASSNFPTEESMGAQIFNLFLPLNFLNMGVLAPNLAFLEENFLTAQNLGVGVIAPPTSRP